MFFRSATILAILPNTLHRGGRGERRLRVVWAIPPECEGPGDRVIAMGDEGEAAYKFLCVGHLAQVPLG